MDENNGNSDNNDNTDLTTSHDLISKVTPEEWDSFEEAVKMIADQDLANIADRLGCGQHDGWQDYADAFADYEWYQFCEAYQHCLDRPFEMAT
jgi:hypothetical protein